MYPLTALSQTRGDKPAQTLADHDREAGRTAETRWCGRCGVHKAKGDLCPVCAEEAS